MHCLFVYLSLFQYDKRVHFSCSSLHLVRAVPSLEHRRGSINISWMNHFIYQHYIRNSAQPTHSKKFIDKPNFTFRSHNSCWGSPAGQWGTLLSTVVAFWHQEHLGVPLWTVVTWHAHCKEAVLDCAGRAAQGKIIQPITDQFPVLAEVVFFSFFP